MICVSLSPAAFVHYLSREKRERELRKKEERWMALLNKHAGGLWVFKPIFPLLFFSLWAFFSITKKNERHFPLVCVLHIIFRAWAVHERKPSIGTNFQARKTQPRSLQLNANATNVAKRYKCASRMQPANIQASIETPPFYSIRLAPNWIFGIFWLSVWYIEVVVGCIG